MRLPAHRRVSRSRFSALTERRVRVGRGVQTVRLPNGVWAALESRSAREGLSLQRLVDEVFRNKRKDETLSRALWLAAREEIGGHPNREEARQRGGSAADTASPLTQRERRAKVREILNSLDAYAPPRVGDLDLSEPGRVRIKKGRERPMKFS